MFPTPHIIPAWKTHFLVIFQQSIAAVVKVNYVHSNRNCGPQARHKSKYWLKTSPLKSLGCSFARLACKTRTSFTCNTFGHSQVGPHSKANIFCSIQKIWDFLGLWIPGKMSPKCLQPCQHQSDLIPQRPIQHRLAPCFKTRTDLLYGHNLSAQQTRLSKFSPSPWSQVSKFRSPRVNTACMNNQSWPASLVQRPIKPALKPGPNARKSPRLTLVMHL